MYSEIFNFLISPFFASTATLTSKRGGLFALNKVALPLTFPENVPEKFSIKGGRNGLNDERFKSLMSKSKTDSFDFIQSFIV
jgi:hypothetical protein